MSVIDITTARKSPPKTTAFPRVEKPIAWEPNACRGLQDLARKIVTLGGTPCPNCGCAGHRHCAPGGGDAA